MRRNEDAEVSKQRYNKITSIPTSWLRLKIQFWLRILSQLNSNPGLSIELLITASLHE